MPDTHLSISDYTAVIAGKLTASIIRTCKAGLGSNLPGRVATSLSKTVLTNLIKQVRCGVIAISGTNGKSTSAGFLSSILQQTHKIAHNRQGANLVSGITASVIDAANWSASLEADYCIFEVDEAALPLIAQQVKLSAVLVTNLFRDQLDRFGELDTTAALIGKGIAHNDSLAILNADDPNVAQLAPNCRKIYYGIESTALDHYDDKLEPCFKQQLSEVSTSELSYCLVCGREYVFSLKFYGQLGHYKCPACKIGRPETHISAQNIVRTAYGSKFILNYGKQSLDISISYPGLFNIYNALGAAAVAFALDIPSWAVEAGISSYTTLFGRSEHLIVNNKTVVIQLIKNPIGASQAVKVVTCDQNAHLLIAINDKAADGKDVSWLWDVDFEYLLDHTGPIIVSGLRCYDMALRLKYAGISTEKIIVIPSLKKAVLDALEVTDNEKKLWILPTYTCLLEFQKIMRSLGYSLSGT